MVIYIYIYREREREDRDVHCILLTEAHPIYIYILTAVTNEIVKSDVKPKQNLRGVHSIFWKDIRIICL